MAIAIGPVLLILLLIVAAVYLMARNQTQTVHFVNGLQEAYSVRVAGRDYRLEPQKPVPVTVRQGDVLIEIIDGPLLLQPVTIPISVGLVEGISKPPVLIANPDRMAIVEYEETQYAAGNNHTFDGRNDYHVGKVLHRFANVDYLFEPFPDEIDLLTPRSREIRKRVSIEKASEPAMAVFFLLVNEGEEAAATYIRRFLDFYPGHAGMLSMAAFRLPAEEYLARVRPQLEVLPANEEIHLDYIEFMRHRSEGESLEAEYLARVTANPRNGTLLYLMSQVVSEKGEAEKLLALAMEAPEPSAGAAFEAARRALCRGDFAEAHRIAAFGFALPGPHHEGREEIVFQTQIAAGMFDAYIEGKKSALLGRPSAIHVAGNLVVAYAMTNRSFLARDLIEEMVATNGEDHRAWMESRLLLGEGRFTEYFQAIAKLWDPAHDHLYQLHVGNCERAFVVLEEDGADGPADYLLVYTVAEKRMARVAAKDALRRAVEELMISSPEHQRLAGMLRGNEAPSVDEMRGLLLMPEEKVVALAALGMHFPAIRDAAHSMAREFNYQRLPQQGILLDIIGR